MTFFKRFVKSVPVIFALALASTVVSTTSNAATVQTAQSPYVVLETTGKNLFGRIANNQAELAKFPELMERIVEEELMPNVDYRYAAYKVLGKHLKHTTKEQRAKFVNSMRNYLVRTYAKALEQYDDQQVIFEPAKDVTGKRIVAVNTKIVDPNKPTIHLAFKMRQNKKSKEWKAFDMVVEGISLLQSKQSELSKRIAKRGVDQVTLELASVAK